MPARGTHTHTHTMRTYSRKRPVHRMRCTDPAFDGLCRLCLSPHGDRVHMFSDVADVPLPLKIMACVSIEVFEGDGLPAEICHLCAQQVESSYKFRQKCESTDVKLRQFLKSLKDVQPPAKESHSRDCSDLQILPESSMGKHKTVKALLDLLTDVENPCKGLKYSNEIHSDVEQMSTDSAGLECTNTNVELDTSLVDEDVTLIQNIQNAFRSSEHAKDIVSEQCATTIHEEMMKEDPNKWQDNGNKEAGTLGEAVAAGFQILGHEQSSVIRLDEMKQEMATKGLSEGTNYLLPEAESAARENTGKGTQQDKLETIKETLLFPCGKCPKRFAKRMDLKRHSSVHDEQRGYVCEVCEKWFPNKTSFKRHERIHTGERPYACMYCEKRFSQDTILTRHIMTHTGEKPFKCTVCSKGFTQREGLKVHMRQHSSEKIEIQQHDCPLCDKSFCHQSGLSRHLIVHTGKTFDCTVCTKSFTDQSSLRRHLKRHTENDDKTRADTANVR